MALRFFVDSPIVSGAAALTGGEAHHLAHVMRQGVGAEVVLFDDSGAEFDARVTSLSRSAVHLEILQRRVVNRESAKRLVIGVALPKGERQRWLIEKLVELGVAALVPLTTARCVARPLPNAVKRLRRTVVEASKQCGRNRLMRIDDPQEVERFLQQPPDTALRWLAQPGGERPGPSSGHPAPAHVAIGPEGGWTAAELATAQACDWQLVDLGPRVLRVETAAVLLAALLVWDDSATLPR